MPPTILFVASGSLWAGAEMQVYTLMDSVKDRAQLIAVLFNEGALAEKLRASGIEVAIIDETQQGLFGMIRLLRSIIASQSVKLIHTHGYKENIIGGIAGFLAGVPSLRTVHGDNEFKVSLFDVKRSIPANLNLIVGNLIQKYIVSVSAELADKLSKKYSRNKITVIPNGINIQKVMSAADRCITLSNHQDSFKIGFIGRLVRLKRVDLIIQAYAELYQRYGLKYELFIVGEGDEEATLKDMAKKLNITEGVHFLGHRMDVYDLMSALDCLVMASDHEGLPMTILEAIALKLPIVSHAVGEIPEVLEQGRCGYLVTEQTPEKFRGAIEACRANAEIAEMTSRALVRLREKYSHEHNADSYFKLYQRILAVKY